MKNYFEPDAQWLSVYEIKSIEEHNAKFVFEINFNSGVPVDLHRGARVIEELMVYSYYNIDILDEVVRKALGIFELSVKLKIVQLGGVLEKVNSKGKSRAIVLDHLIKQFNDHQELQHLVPLLDELRKLRNRYTHPKQHNVSGSLTMGLVEKVSGVVNEMFIA